MGDKSAENSGSQSPRVVQAYTYLQLPDNTIIIVCLICSPEGREEFGSRGKRPQAHPQQSYSGA